MFEISLLLSAFALAGQSQPAVAAGAARAVPLVEKKGGQGEYCTGDGRWCVFLVSGEDGLRPVVRSGAASPEVASDLAEGDDARTVWPMLFVLEGGGFLAGVEVHSSTGYSGGGGSATELQLYQTLPGGSPGLRPIFKQALEGSLMIRACFGERDAKRRLDVCHDEYGFSASLKPGAGNAGGLPVLDYATEAWAYPRGVSRSGDSTQMPPLRKRDLVRGRDATCSFSRRFLFDPDLGAYRPDRPLPDCSDFTDP